MTIKKERPGLESDRISEFDYSHSMYDTWYTARPAVTPITGDIWSFGPTPQDAAAHLLEMYAESIRAGHIGLQQLTGEPWTDSPNL